METFPHPHLLPRLLRALGDCLPGPARALRLARLLIPISLCLGLLAPLVLPAQTADVPDDRTPSPYFWVKTAVSETETGQAPDPLPLKSTRVEATLAGVIAEVQVTQTYANTGAVPLEAVYVFPGSTRAAVHGLTLTVGDRRIEAAIRERGAARQAYETAKSEGRTASLLEQQRPNVFQMAVANILPGDLVQVELRYTELLSPVEGVYTFVYPGVVGPRYSRAPAPGAGAGDSAWVQNPYFPQGTVDPAGFDLAVRLAAGVPIQDMACPTHATRIQYSTTTDARVTLAPGEPNPGDRDFLLRYRLAGPALAAGLLLSEGEGENFFLAMIQPPERPAPAELPPRDHVFVLDVSGSMNGFPLDVARGLLRDLLAAPRPGDTFNLLLFAGDNRALSETSLPATPANLARALAFLDANAAGGGTELLPALRRALDLPRPAENTARVISVITDGYVTVESEAYTLVRQNLQRGNVFAFGIGASVNRELIEGLARAGRGEPFVVTDAESAAAAAARFRDYVASPILTGITVSIEGFEAYEVEPVSLPDVFARRPMIFFGKWRGPRAGAITLSGRTGAAPFQTTILPAAAAPLTGTSALSHLWARHRIADLEDELALRPGDEALKAAITHLGLEHRLLTRFTSFVAIDTEIRRATPGLETVRQPLPLPQGVTNQAVGGGTPIVPEPSTYGLIVTASALLLAAFRRRFRR